VKIGPIVIGLFMVGLSYLSYCKAMDCGGYPTDSPTFIISVREYEDMSSEGVGQGNNRN
jgi:hypothetical protein